MAALARFSFFLFVRGELTLYIQAIFTNIYIFSYEYCVVLYCISSWKVNQSTCTSTDCSEVPPLVAETVCTRTNEIIVHHQVNEVSF